MFFPRDIEIRKFRTNLRRLYLAAVVLFASPDPLPFAAGAGLAAAGVLVHFWASGYLTRGKTLVAGGPYAMVRNPFYTAAIVIDLGFGIASRNWIALAAFLPVITAVYMRRIIGEEKALSDSFGDSYGAYRMFCPSRLIPLPWNLFRAPPCGGVEFSFSRVLQNGEIQRAASHAAIIAIVGLPMIWDKPWGIASIPARIAALCALAVVLAAASVRVRKAESPSR